MKRFVLIITILFLLSSCPVEEERFPPLGKNDRVTEVNFYGHTQSIILRNLYRNNIFLVKINTSTAEVENIQTGGAYIPPQHLANKEAELNAIEELLIKGHPDASRIQANPPAIPNENTMPRSPSPLASSNAIGDKHNFWVESVFGSRDYVYREAILQAIGEYCKIWVMPNNDSNKTITQMQARTLAQKFDIIYPAATNILGYEFGGGPNGDNGRDGDPKIQILVYDIGEGCAVYFSSKDFYAQNSLDSDYRYSNMKTNYAEMFYINAETANKNPDFIYSTLIHEFQHLVNWNVKTVKYDIESDIWYNEMLSLMAEDTISSLIGISTSSTGHVQQEMSLFLANYALTGITEWNYDSLSYSHKYAYGAYLLRNYGGAALLKEIISNNLTNEASITAALNRAYSSEINFQYTLNRFAEALIYARPLPDGVMTFDKTVSNTINGITYTSYGFNIWDIKNPYPHAQYNLLSYFGGYGPLVISLEYWINMPRHSISLFSHESWLNITGDVLITLERPINPNIKYFLMIL